MKEREAHQELLLRYVAGNLRPAEEAQVADVLRSVGHEGQQSFRLTTFGPTKHQGDRALVVEGRSVQRNDAARQRGDQQKRYRQSGPRPQRGGGKEFDVSAAHHAEPKHDCGNAEHYQRDDGGGHPVDWIRAGHDEGGIKQDDGEAYTVGNDKIPVIAQGAPAEET